MTNLPDSLRIGPCTRDPIARLDENWEIELEAYKCSNHGVRFLPRKNTSILSGMLFAALGIFIICAARCDRFFIIIGAIFCLVRVFSSIYEYRKACAHEIGYRIYQKKRAELLCHQREASENRYQQIRAEL